MDHADTLSPGQLVAMYRRRRGITQVVLADRVGRTESWIEKIESGRAQLDRLSVLRTLADALRITPADLVGELRTSDHEPGAPRRTSLSYTTINPRLAANARPLPPDQILALTDQVWTSYQDGRFGFSVAKLDAALPAAYAAANQSNRRQPEALRNLAHLYHAAASILTKQGDLTAARVCAERGDHVAQETDDVVTRLSLQRSIAHTLLAQGELEASVHVVRDGLVAAAEPIGPLEASVAGALMLVGAVASARAGDRLEAATFLRHAGELADRVGHGHNLAWTAFGPTNVALHRITTAAELGDYGVVAGAEPIETAGLPRERQTRHHLEMARGLFEIGRHSESEPHILEAHRAAPELFAHHFIARDLLSRWMASKTRPGPALMALARQLGHAT